MTQQFANGGLVQGATTFTSTFVPKGTVIISSHSNMSSINQSFKDLAKKTKKLEWTLSQIGDPNLCHNRRGGPRSRIYCEVPKSVPHDYCTGRSKAGRWFSWKPRDV